MSGLAAEGLVVAYGAEPVLRNVHLEIAPGEVVAVLGPNGAGKTTLFKTIAGLVEQREGRVLLDGVDLGSTRAEARARRGVLLVPEGRRLFRRLTVVENLRAGRFSRRDGYSLDDVYGIFPRLAERKSSEGSQLSGGEQQMLAIGRALVGGPSVLLVDEPSLGLAPLVVQTVFETFRTLAANGLAIVIAEQNVAAATAVSDRCVILDAGEIVFESRCTSVEEVAAVNDAYASVIEIGATTT
jgi:branched-chain amino acid transport system ATP-binding protein